MQGLRNKGIAAPALNRRPMPPIKFPSMATTNLITIPAAITPLMLMPAVMMVIPRPVVPTGVDHRRRRVVSGGWNHHWHRPVDHPRRRRGVVSRLLHINRRRRAVIHRGRRIHRRVGNHGAHRRRIDANRPVNIACCLCRSASQCATKSCKGNSDLLFHGLLHFRASFARPRQNAGPGGRR